jgi:hypothetical protein
MLYDVPAHMMYNERNITVNDGVAVNVLHEHNFVNYNKKYHHDSMLISSAVVIVFFFSRHSMD